MTRPAGWLRVFRFWRRDVGRDVDAEIAFHFAERVEDLVARGLSRDDAHAKAGAEFGDVADVRSRLVQIDDRIAQQRRRADWWESTVQDLRYALRGLRKSPQFTVLVALTLALGLGANAAIFSVLERLLWQRPPGVVKPDDVKRLHQNYSDNGHRPQIRSAFSYVELRAIRAQLPPSQALAGYQTTKVRIGAGDNGPLVAGAAVVGDYFGVLGPTPALGRFFSADEARAETFEPVAVISYGLWLRTFAGGSDAIGKPLDLGSHRYTVIGVAPRGFRGIDVNSEDVWIPLSTNGRWKNRDAKWYDNKNRTSIRGVTRVESPAQVVATEAAMQRGLHEVSFMADTSVTASLSSVIESVWPDAGTKQLTTATRLAGAALIILLITCANVTNLLLARAMRRRREIAVRVALGVSRRRLAAQFITESVLLALIGATAAVFLGAVGASALRNGLLPGIVWGSSTLDVKIVIFTSLVAIITGLAIGVAPAVRATRPDLVTTLKAGARDGVYQRSRLRAGLIIAQAALSVVLLAGAGLFIRSLHAVSTTDIGYDREQLLLASVTFDPEGDSHSKEIRARLPELADRVARLPGVESVGLTWIAPFNGFGWTDVFMPGRDSVPPGSFSSFVSPGFFPATGVRVVRGRGLNDDDREGKAPVIVVNETMARGFWPGENAVGKCLMLDERKNPCREVVGVVSDAHVNAIIEDPPMQFYVPIAQWREGVASEIVVRTAPGHTRDVAPAVRQAAIETFGAWAQPSLTTLAQELEPQLRPWRFAATMFGCAGLLALLVAAVGIYSAVGYAVSQRMHEMGVRTALGARSADILRLVVGEGVRMVVIGVVIGVGLALALGRVVASLLYNTSTHDPVLLTGVSVGLVLVAVVACVVPAWRATRANPIDVLRAD